MNRKKQKRDVRIKKARRKAVICGVCVAAAAFLVIIFINSMLRRTLEQYEPDIIIDGVFIGDTDVSGMTAEEAEAAVGADTEQISGELIIFDLGDGREARATLKELGLSVKELDKIIGQAVDYGKKGSRVEAYKILKASEKGEQKRFPIRYQVTEESVGEVLLARIDGLLNSPQNAALTQQDGVSAVIGDEPGEALNLKETAAELNEFLGEGWKKEGGRVQAVLDQVQADITEEDLQEITDVLGTYSTNYGTSSEARKKNVESGAGHIDGILIRPGEEISVNELLSPYTPENGYENAPSYAGNEVVESMGGGICQVSTTLYNALLYAEIEITERHEHSMMVGYVDPSRDAAIAEGLKDLKFRNNLENPIYIEGTAADGTLTFNIYGKESRVSGRTVEYESETVEMVEPDETDYIAVDESIGTMYTESEGKQGRSARLWKVVTENGEEISRDIINDSYYLATDRKVAVGTASEDAAETEKMKAAIETQDLEKIEKAMAEIAESRAQADEEQQGEL